MKLNSQKWPRNFVPNPLEDEEVSTEFPPSVGTSPEPALPAPRSASTRNHTKIFSMSRCQIRFLIKQTLIAMYLNGLFSAIGTWLVFRNMAVVPLSGRPNLIMDFILETFITTLMSILPPSILTSLWMLTRTDLTTARTPTIRTVVRALLTALVACLASYVVLPFAMPRLLAASLPFLSLLALKCLYGMAIGLAITPLVVAAVFRGPRRGEDVRSIDGP